MSDIIEVIFSFDTTGSMFPCLTQVRQNIRELAQRLFKDIPGLRIGVIAHGDYCDRSSTYVTSHLGLTNDPGLVESFVKDVRSTGGGDAPECYELVLREAGNSPGWTEGSRRALVMIGDDVPHEPRDNPLRIDWRTELEVLAGCGIKVYGVQCLGRRHADGFWRELGERSGGFHVTLDQFAYVHDLVLAICYQQQGGAERVAAYESEVEGQGRMSRGLNRMFSGMLARHHEPREAGTRFSIAADLRACSPCRFQVLDVGSEDAAIKDFVVRNGLLFKTGRGFYEFTKTETIQGYKEVVLMDRASGDLYEGKVAREMIGLSTTAVARLKPAALGKYRVFVQSTSANRRLVGGTKFLYEVDMSR